MYNSTVSRFDQVTRKEKKVGTLIEIGGDTLKSEVGIADLILNCYYTLIVSSFSQRTTVELDTL